MNEKPTYEIWRSDLWDYIVINDVIQYLIFRDTLIKGHKYRGENLNDHMHFDYVRDLSPEEVIDRLF